jgi:hypothetical protein
LIHRNKKLIELISGEDMKKHKSHKEHHDDIKIGVICCIGIALASKGIDPKIVAMTMSGIADSCQNLYTVAKQISNSNAPLPPLQVFMRSNIQLGHNLLKENVSSRTSMIKNRIMSLRHQSFRVSAQDNSCKSFSKP